MLVALDASENALRAVSYVGRVMAPHKGRKITLFHVIREPGEDLVPSAAERLSLVKKAKKEAAGLFARAREELLSQGVEPERIEEKIAFIRPPATVAQAIVGERGEGGHDTVAVGRRGMSKKEEFLFGSVSSQVVREARGAAVWVVE